MDKSASPSSVLELPRLERMLLWSIRTWGAYHDAPHTVWPILQRVFTDAGVRPALEPFAELMCGLFGGLQRWPDIRCVRCLHLGSDELALLQLLADAAEQSHADLARRLRGIMLPTAARGAAHAAQAVMQVIHRAGLRLRRPTSTAGPTWPSEFQAQHPIFH